MVYKPSKKEIKQIENLNKAYQMIKDGIKLIRDNIPKKDGDIEMQAYKISKNFDKIIKRIQEILEKQYIDNQFLEIISNRKTKNKPDRYNKSGRKSKKKKQSKKNKRTKG